MLGKWISKSKGHLEYSASNSQYLFTPLGGTSVDTRNVWCYSHVVLQMVATAGPIQETLYDPSILQLCFWSQNQNAWKLPETALLVVPDNQEKETSEGVKEDDDDTLEVMEQMKSNLESALHNLSEEQVSNAKKTIEMVKNTQQNLLSRWKSTKSSTS